jgi:hypothetical protein
MVDGKINLDVKERCNHMQHVRAHILCTAGLCRNIAEKQTARSPVIHEKVQVAVQLEEPPAFCGTGIVITACLSAWRLFVSSARSIQLTPFASYFFKKYIDIREAIQNIPDWRCKNNEPH